MQYQRSQGEVLHKRISEPPAYLIIVAGPRQVGKSTLVSQVLQTYPHRYIAADQPTSDTVDSIRLHFGDGLSSQVQAGAAPTAEWLSYQWTQARVSARSNSTNLPFIFAIDEVQKIPRWSEVIKGLWDEDRAQGLTMHVLLLGSSLLLVQQGLSESLAGRYEFIQMKHWSYSEMLEAFDFSLDEYLYFGGYPGSAQFIREESRWREYIRGSLIQPNIEKDILQMTRVDKPALLKTMFELGCTYSGQIISYTKLLGQLQDAGNTVTLAHYLELLSQAGLLTGITKYAGQAHRRRASSPKLNVLNTALMSALAGYTFSQARADRSYWGRLVESAVGAHLYNTLQDTTQLHYWRASPYEVDFVLVNRDKLMAIEVKSGSTYHKPKGLDVFSEKFPHVKQLVVGEGGVPLSEFLSCPAGFWLE
ncbi:MAG: ATP-binding protein [Proteobacteria bacterium]|nr:ATP-binding protein [Pseudomonadota bacterium]